MFTGFAILFIFCDRPIEDIGLCLAITKSTQPLKGRYTFGNCQRPVFSLGVSHHKHIITSL